MSRRDPVAVLLESEDPDARSEAFLDLARRALERNDPTTAAGHAARAAALRPGDPRPGELIRALAGKGGRRRWVSAARWAFRRGT